jgi:predicted AAA+ superfamily ATPase
VRHDGLLMIDEIQRVPELPLAVKGRAETIELWPLSQGEIDSASDGFVDALFRLDGTSS